VWQLALLIRLLGVATDVNRYRPQNLYCALITRAMALGAAEIDWTVSRISISRPAIGHTDFHASLSLLAHSCSFQRGAGQSSLVSCDNVHMQSADHMFHGLPTLLPLQALADRLGVHVVTLVRHAKAGRLHARKVCGRWTVTEDAALEFVGGYAGPASEPAPELRP
jgi:hypothetical protein